jgi:ABC-type uncharacterized transport system permease subunit
MLMTLANLAAIATYIGAAFGLARWPSPGQRRSLCLGLLTVAVAAHAAGLYPSTVMADGLNFSVFNAGSLVAWCVALAMLILLVRLKPVESLAVAVLPLVAAAVVVELAFPNTRAVISDIPAGLRLHIALAIVAYSLFAIATLQALFLAFAERKLRRHQPVLHFLPPLPAMEAVMFQLTLMAFVLLTVSLGLGAIYTGDIHAQHLTHKIVFSLLAWLVFATLVGGRWYFGWRGRHAIRYVTAGFVLLALAFFGTKIVLELILGRI